MQAVPMAQPTQQVPQVAAPMAQPVMQVPMVNAPAPMVGPMYSNAAGNMAPSSYLAADPFDFVNIPNVVEPTFMGYDDIVFGEG
jgi:hypothetical protein